MNLSSESESIGDNWASVKSERAKFLDAIDLIMIGLTTAQSVKPSYYQTRGRRPRVDDMAVSHDEQLSNIIVQRHILVQSAHVTTYIGHVVQFRWIGFLSKASRSRYSWEVVALIRPYKV